MKNQAWVPASAHVGASVGTDRVSPVLTVNVPTGGYFRRLAKCIHKYSHGAPFFSVTVDEDGTWYTFSAHPDNLNACKFKMPVSLNVIEPARTEEFFGLLKSVEDTYDTFIDLKYIKNIAHKLTSDERRRVQKWISSGNSIENF